MDETMGWDDEGVDGGWVGGGRGWTRMRMVLSRPSLSHDLPPRSLQLAPLWLHAHPCCSSQTLLEAALWVGH